MADAAWSPDDSSFRSPFCLMSDRRPVKSMVPGMKGTTRLTGRSFHGFPARPSGSSAHAVWIRGRRLGPWVTFGEYIAASVAIYVRKRREEWEEIRGLLALPEKARYGANEGD